MENWVERREGKDLCPERERERGREREREREERERERGERERTKVREKKTKRGTCLSCQSMMTLSSSPDARMLPSGLHLDLQIELLRKKQKRPNIL